MSVAERLAEVRGRVASASVAAGRDADSVTLVVVTKEVDLDDVRAAVALGAVDLGENRAQDLARRAEALAGDDAASVGAPLRWHFIGRLQRNKVRLVAPVVALWESVDRSEVAAEIGRRVPGAAVLVQVNVTGEPQKGGCPPTTVRALVDACTSYGCRVAGLMTVPEAVGDPRPAFARLRELSDDLGLRECSMGMSGDFEIAIAEGATMVRVGSAIFGPRPERPDARR